MSNKTTSIPPPSPAKRHAPPSPAASTSKQRRVQASSHPQEQQQPQHAPAKISLDEYRARYKQIFPVYRFYLDQFDPAEQAQVVARVQALGAAIEPFFSNRCTHVVTAQPLSAQHGPDSAAVPLASTTSLHTIDPNRIRTRSALALTQRPLHDDKNPFKTCSGVVAQALRMNVRVWSCEKLLKILTVFDGKTASLPKARPDHPKERSGLPDLRTLLAAEKVMGTASTLSASRQAAAQSQIASVVPHAGSDELESTSGYYKSLSGVYLLVEDATQVHRPIYYETYEEPSFPDDVPCWPILYPHGGDGRCPFTAPASDRRVHRSRNAVQSLRVELDEAQVAQAAYQDVTVTPENVEAESFAAVQVENDSLLAAAQPASGLSMGRTPAPDFTASGASALGARSSVRTTSTVAPTDGTLAPSLRHNSAVGALQHRTTVTGPAAKVTVPSRTSRVREFMGRPKAERQLSNRRAHEKGGYCENCRTQFDDLDTHVASRRHKRFARDDRNFAEVDALLLEIARIPLEEME